MSLSKKTLEKRRKVINLYILENESVKSISVKCNLSATTVYCILRASGVKIKQKGRYKNQKPERRIEIKEESDYILYFLYIVLNLKRGDLARLFQCSTSTIDKLLKKYNIKRK